jgi:serine/threonine protein phosphatase 1
MSYTSGGVRPCNGPGEEQGRKEDAVTELTQMTAPGVLPPGERIYAVGDVHGCAERLANMHAAIAADLQARPVERPLLIHLGDYVDRGPDSAGVVQRLLDGPAIEGLPVINLVGNHEAMMLEALEGEPAAIRVWLANGGDRSLESWGIAPDSPPSEWAGRVPAEHLRQLRSLNLLHAAGDYLFVHAGIRPGIKLEEQEVEDLLWIREPFLSWDERLGPVVVHGHTPRPAPEVWPHRIGVDTGAVMGGALTCAVLEGNTVGFLSA